MDMQLRYRFFTRLALPECGLARVCGGAFGAKNAIDGYRFASKAGHPADENDALKAGNCEAVGRTE